MSKPATAITEATETTTAPAAPRAPLKPLQWSAVRKNYDGFAFSEYLVRLPLGMTINDIYGDPSLWSAIQGGGNGLKKLDRLTLVDYHENVCATALVSSSNNSAAVLTKPQIFELQTRSVEADYSTELYRTVWGGSGWATFRKSDGHEMVPPHASKAAAIAAHDKLYPQKIRTW